MRRIMLALPLACVFASCGDNDDDGRTMDADAAYVAETPEAAAELLAPVRAVGMPMIEFSEDAARRAASGDVRQYATVVAADHRGLINALDSAAGARTAVITQTPAAEELENSVRMAHAGLSGLEGEAYDLAFIRAQVEAHRQMLDRLELDLIPGATSAEMQQLLRDIQIAEDAHLTRARQILAALLGTSPDPSPEGATPTAPVIPVDTGG